MMYARLHTRGFLVAIVVCALLPIVASAQTDAGASDELRASIQTALLSDPRTDSLPPEELSALVDALVADATAHDILPADISYVPRPVVAGEAQDSALPETCDTWCIFANAYGLDSVDPTTPILLIVSSGLLIMIFRRALRPQHHEHFTGIPHPSAAPAPKPVDTNAPQRYV